MKSKSTLPVGGHQPGQNAGGGVPTAPCEKKRPILSTLIKPHIQCGVYAETYQQVGL